MVVCKLEAVDSPRRRRERGDKRREAAQSKRGRARRQRRMVAFGAERTGFRREHLGGWWSTAESLAGVEGAQGEGEDGLEDPSEHLPHQQQADDAEAAQRAAEMLDAARQDRKSVVQGKSVAPG